MNDVTQGLIAGIAFGILSIAIMVPMPLPQKREAMLAAFLHRLGVGFTIAVAVMPVPGWIKGALLGLLLSVPSAIVAKAYVPILGLGVVGGAVIGWIVH
jgi:hypothetical protein